MPGAAHAQVGVQGEAVIEADEHVFAHRFDGGDVAADDLVNRGARRPGRSREDRLADEDGPGAVFVVELPLTTRKEVYT